MGGMVGGDGGGGGSSSPDYGHGDANIAYTPTPASTPYAPSYAPQTATPFLQSVMAQHSGQNQQNNSLGLPSLQSMFGMQQHNSPLQGGLQQLSPMPQYVGSTYRPNMSAIQQNLNNVAPSVDIQQKQAAAADAQNPFASSLRKVSHIFGGGS